MSRIYTTKLISLWANSSNFCLNENKQRVLFSPKSAYTCDLFGFQFCQVLYGKNVPSMLRPTVLQAKIIVIVNKAAAHFLPYAQQNYHCMTHIDISQIQ